MPYEERIDVHSPWWGEHVARYEFARGFVRGRVLDVACGSGYGLEVLQPHAEWIVGVDLDETALARASAVVDRRRGEVLRADATALPFERASFDCVTSFETLEHLEERERFVDEIARVLRPDGTFIVSTPNALHTRPIDGIPRNPFHRHEYAVEELRVLLDVRFGEVRLFGQTMDARFVVPPFAWDQQFVTDRVVRANVFARRVLYRLPRAVQDAASQLLWGHPFFPTASDYRFVAPDCATATNLVALCRVPRGPMSC